MPSSRGSSQPRDRTQVSRIAGEFFYCLSHPWRKGWGGGDLPKLGVSQI